MRRVTLSMKTHDTLKRIHSELLGIINNDNDGARLIAEMVNDLPGVSGRLPEIKELQDRIDRHAREILDLEQQIADVQDDD